MQSKYKVILAVAMVAAGILLLFFWIAMCFFLLGLHGFAMSILRRGHQRESELGMMHCFYWKERIRNETYIKACP